jgi:hypothetical protein
MSRIFYFVPLFLLLVRRFVCFASFGPFCSRFVADEFGEKSRADDTLMKNEVARKQVVDAIFSFRKFQKNHWLITLAVPNDGSSAKHTPARSTNKSSKKIPPFISDVTTNTHTLTHTLDLINH